MRIALCRSTAIICVFAGTFAVAFIAGGVSRMIPYLPVCTNLAIIWTSSKRSVWKIPPHHRYNVLITVSACRAKHSVCVASGGTDRATTFIAGFIDSQQ